MLNDTVMSSGDFFPPALTPVSMPDSDRHRFDGDSDPVSASSSPSDSSYPSRPPSPFDHDRGLPSNFGEVVKGVYRSSFPKPENLESLAKLNLKTIITLVEEDWSPEYAAFVRQHNINSYIIPIVPNKVPGVSSSQTVIDHILRIILDPRNHPLLIHCNKGRHRTGCTVACFRKLQGWSITTVLAEYQKYAAPKARVLDKSFIQNYDPTALAPVVKHVGARQWLPSIIPVTLGLPVLEDFNHPKEKDQAKKLSHSEPKIVHQMPEE